MELRRSVLGSMPQTFIEEQRVCGGLRGRKGERERDREREREGGRKGRRMQRDGGEEGDAERWR